MQRFHHRGRGFTMIEILAVLGIIAVLAAVMTPSIVKHIKDARVTRTTQDVEAIAAALGTFYKDTGRWPTDRDANHAPNDQEVRLLWTDDGERPRDANGAVGWDALTPRDTFDNQLLHNTPNSRVANAYPTTGSQKWDGPYLLRFRSDPWGRKYVCNIGALHPGQSGPVWVLSAGPDGLCDTPPDSYTLEGDDIGFLLEG